MSIDDEIKFEIAKYQEIHKKVDELLNYNRFNYVLLNDFLDKSIARHVAIENMEESLTYYSESK